MRTVVVVYVVYYFPATYSSSGIFDVIEDIIHRVSHYC